MSEQNLKTLTAKSTGKYQRAEAFRFNIKKTMEGGVVGTLPAGQRTGQLDPYWCEPTLKQVAQLDGYESSSRVYSDDGLCPTINTMGGGQREPKISVKTWNGETKALKTKANDMPRDRIYIDESIGFAITTNESQMPHIAIKEATTKGYAEASDGDGVYLNRPHQKRGVVQKGMIQTIKTSGSDVGVVVTKEYANLRIRKLTPFECWRLMGISDEDFYKAKNAGVSNSQLYKQAGNGIVVNVFEAILREMIR